MKKLRNNKKGFTLIEVIVVLVIIGILLAIAVPSIMGYVQQAREAKYIANARNGFVAAQTITARHNTGEYAAAKPEVTVKTVAEELNIAEDEFKSITCEWDNKTKNLEKCSIQVKGLDEKKEVLFVVGGEAKVITKE